MPVRNVGSGYRCGHAKNVYKYKPNSKVSKRAAERKARKQCIAIHFEKRRRALRKK